MFGPLAAISAAVPARSRHRADAAIQEHVIETHGSRFHRRPVPDRSSFRSRCAARAPVGRRRRAVRLRVPGHGRGLSPTPARHGSSRRAPGRRRLERQRPVDHLSVDRGRAGPAGCAASKVSTIRRARRISPPRRRRVPRTTWRGSIRRTQVEQKAFAAPAAPGRRPRRRWCKPGRARRRPRGRAPRPIARAWAGITRASKVASAPMAGRGWPGPSPGRPGGRAPAIASRAGRPRLLDRRDRPDPRWGAGGPLSSRQGPVDELARGGVLRLRQDNSVRAGGTRPGCGQRRSGSF